MNKNNLMGIGGLLLGMAMALHSSEIDFPKLTGPYLGQKPPGMTPEIFAPGIVSTADSREFSGAFTPDGKEYYFFRFAEGEGMMATQLTSDGWTKPRPAPFDTEYIDNEPHITADGRRLFFCSNRPYPGSWEGRRMTQVWFMERQGDEWGEPKHLGMGMFPTTTESGLIAIGANLYALVDDRLKTAGSLEYDAAVPPNERLMKQHTCVSPDERFHIFDFNEKLYVSFRTERGTWGAPIDLSQKLDLPEGEMLPTLSPDRQYLFFCNRGDIYWVSAKVIEELQTGFTPTFPTVLFDKSLVLDMGDMTVELYAVGGNHTASDIMIFVPEEGLVAVGGMRPDQLLPFLRKEAPWDLGLILENWGRIVESGREIKHVNFAHSDMRLGVEMFKQQYRYLKTLWDGLREMQAGGATLEDARKRFAVERDFPYFKDRMLKIWDIDIHQNNV